MSGPTAPPSAETEWPALARSRYGRLAETAAGLFEGERLFDLVGRMTMVILLLYVRDHAYLVPPLMALALAGLMITPVLRHPLFWAAIILLLTVFFTYHWYRIDNHKYLLLYWCLAMGLSRFARDPLGVLAWNGRMLISLCFALAVAWKLMTPEFRDGTFFEYVLLTDSRFYEVAWLIGGLSPSTLAVNDDRMHQLLDFMFAGESVVLQSNATIASMATVMTAWTVLIEGAIAAAFLWPREGWLRSSRHIFLLLFMVTTYPVATVPAFAMLLAAMAVAQTERARPLVLVMFVLVFAAVPLFSLPIADLGGAVLGEAAP